MYNKILVLTLNKHEWTSHASCNRSSRNHSVLTVEWFDCDYVTTCKQNVMKCPIRMRKMGRLNDFEFLWYQKSEVNGQNGLSWQKSNSYSFKHLITTKIHRSASLNLQYIKPWWRSAALHRWKTVAWSDDSQFLWMVGSEFGVNNIKAWIHPTLYQRFRQLLLM